ncbi:hypothetical protein ACFQ61_31970 [Streptomyces sp. NPDC056500]|uniref:hypothetical protein n=1 Tax=Streptomyces sp. NPDC056500 TaxID=3345840 RepID=UPI003687BCF9
MTDLKPLRKADWPAPLVRNVYPLKGPTGEGFRQARLAVGVPLYRISDDDSDENDD